MKLHKFFYELSKSATGSVLRNFVNLILPERELDVSVLFGSAKGIKMSLHLKREKAYWLGIHELEVQRYFTEMIKPGFVIYDIGANIGFYSLLASKLAGPSGQCFAFEPVPRNIDRLKRNIELNQMHNVNIVPMAVSDSYRQGVFKPGVNDSMGTLIYDKQVQDGLISVPVTTIDRFVLEDGNPPPNFIKMDIEGEEGNAIIGMREVLKKFRPYIVCELSGYESSSIVWDTLKDMKYEIFDVVSKSILETTPSYINIFAIPSENI